LSDFDFTEVEYSSPLLTTIDSWIREVVSGQTPTGLPASIENALFARALSRDERTYRSARLAAAEEWARRGFSMPTGPLNRRLDEIEQQRFDARSNLSREILIQQKQLEVENLREYTARGIQLEGILINLHSEKMTRALDAAKFTFQATVEVFNALVNVFNAEVGLYETEARVFRELIEAENLKIERYRAQIEAQRAINELNLADVQIYTEQVRAQLARVEIYRAQIEAANGVVAGNRAKIENFRALLEKERVEIEARDLDLRGYLAEIQAEQAKLMRTGSRCRRTPSICGQLPRKMKQNCSVGSST